MKTKQWGKVVLMYFFTVSISLLLFLPIDILTHGYLITTHLGRYFIINISMLSVLFFLFEMAENFFNSKFLANRLPIRILIELIYVFFIINLAMFLFQNFFEIKVSPIKFAYRIFKSKHFWTSTFEGIFVMLLIEILHLYYKYREREREREKFKYDQLKSQLNPHFLFNSLNILLAMIYKRKPNECANFIEKLSDVYRYILNNDDKGLILVKEEVDFIGKYGEILKTRFNNGFVLNINLKEEDMKKKILLMSLQLLVENAVKHNIACDQTPLIINIFSENNSIVVSNTKNIRSKAVVSTGIGLENLNQRYRIVANKEIEIINEDSIFNVIIPLI